MDKFNSKKKNNYNIRTVTLINQNLIIDVRDWNDSIHFEFIVFITRTIMRKYYQENNSINYLNTFDSVGFDDVHHDRRL